MEESGRGEGGGVSFFTGCGFRREKKGGGEAVLAAMEEAMEPARRVPVADPSTGPQFVSWQTSGLTPGLVRRRVPSWPHSTRPEP
jgi:hypothetical protein